MARDPVSFVGIQTVTRNLSAFGEQLLGSLKETNDEKLDEIVKLAVAYAPELTGDLKSTIRVSRKTSESQTGKTILGEVTAGGIPGAKTGKIVNYAGRQHEEHPTKKKYLERAVLQVVPTIPDAYKRSFLRVRL